MGTDEFCAWARRAGSAPMLAVNLGTRDAEAAARLVEYCNHPGGTYWSDLRVKNGTAEPHGVRVWCLGNEMDGDWQIGHKTADAYGRVAAETGKAMRLTASERDRSDPVRAGRAVVAADYIPPVHADQQARPGNGAAHADRRAGILHPGLRHGAKRRRGRRAVRLRRRADGVRGEPRPARAAASRHRRALAASAAPRAHTYIGDDEPSAANTQDAPDRIVPRAGADTPVHDGVLEMALPPLSWNMLRICGDLRRPMRTAWHSGDFVGSLWHCPKAA